MATPERIHINWNASDWWECFEGYGLHNAQRETSNTAQIIGMFKLPKIGKLFQIEGWTEDPQVEISLKLVERNDSGLAVINRGKPPFQGEYVVADEPPPHITMNGDYVFDLVAVVNQ